MLTTGAPPSTCHARLTEMYGVFSSRNTQSHFNPRISSLRNPAYKPIITKTYGGSSRMLSSKMAVCSSVKASRRFAGFPPLAQIVLDGFSLITLLSSAELKMFLISILSWPYIPEEPFDSGTISSRRSSVVTSSIYICPIGPTMYRFTIRAYPSNVLVLTVPDRISSHFSQYSSTVGFSLWKTTSAIFFWASSTRSYNSSRVSP